MPGTLGKTFSVLYVKLSGGAVGRWQSHQPAPKTVTELRTGRKSNRTQAARPLAVNAG